MDEDQEYHDEETLFKVACALREVDLTEDQINASINSMQHYGILFRENLKRPVLGPRLF